ncbi:hypothetical protein LDENG_00270860 [Lucifuga dentata]|nr:hypothetical protein LDENG_00270860 [Lucifuga dentata]
MLFTDYSSAFNTTIPTKFVSKLVDLGLETSICSWIFNFLDGQAPGGENQQSHFLLTDPQHRHTSGLCAQPPPVLPVHL